jgi:hypothetical protein
MWTLLEATWLEAYCFASQNNTEDAGSSSYLFSRPSPSCLSYIPQRWLLYIFTVPHIMYLLSQMSDYTTGMWLWVVVENVVMLTAGGLGTVPWFSRSLKGKEAC